MVWSFTPEQLQDPDKMVEYLKGKCCGDSKETQLTALCWALATIYQTLLESRQHHPEGESRPTGPAAAQAPAAGPAAAQTPATGTAATQTPATGTVAEPKDQPIPVSVAPIHKKKYTRKLVRLVKDDDESGPSREQEESEPEVITRSLSLSELRDMRKDFGMSPEEEVTRAEEAPPYNKLTEDEKPYALFTDGSCRIVGKHRRWKAAVWSPTRRVAEAAEGEGESSQFAEVKAIQLALDIAEREKWPTLYLYTDSWMVANALWGWLQQWKRNNWQRRGKPIWAAPLWQDIAAWLEKLVVKVRHVDAHVPKSRATEEHQNNQQVDQAAKIEVAQVDLDWQRKGELFIARWAHDTSGHQGRDATYRWARDRGVDLSMDAISQVIHQCETCAAIKQAKRVKPLWYGGRWLKYKYGEAWQIDYITLPQTRQGKRYILTMVEATTGWLETYPVPHATARNTILGLEKQVLWRHGTPDRIESDNGTHFRNNLIDTWAKEHGIEWVYHIPYHAPASGKIERYNGLLKTTLRAMGGGTLKHWDIHLAKATWLVNTRRSANRAGPAQSKLPRPVEGDKVPVVHMKNMLGKTVWVISASGKGKPICGIAFAQGPGCTWWVMRKDGEVRCVPQGDLILGENSQ
ncbi:hypothetical protein GRJ2_001729100 [Grus japonensis]|uniref:Uncharacterized protein n=1 Tax=Grus japonensis TaxID=30415 RepID=A0ABC9X4N3_GRUJA